MKTLLVWIATAALAAAAPNFSGEWKMNPAKSEFGPVPAPEVLTRSIKHADPSLQYSTHQKGAQGDVTTEVKYTTDGKPVTNKINGTDSIGTAKWQGDNLVIQSTREIQGMQIESKETWSLDADKKTLTISNHLTIPGQGEFDMKLVLEKQ
jgi:hypothetical protein